MKHTFYFGRRFAAALRRESLSRAPWAVFFLSLASLVGGCGDKVEPVTQGGEGVGPVSPFFVQVARAYEPVAVDQLLPRHIEKLHSGSRDGLRFAKQVIGSYGDEAVPLLVEGLRLELEQHDTVAANFLSALSYTQTTQTLPILLEVLQNHSSPLVRSQAVDTIGLLKQTELLDGLLQHAERESESGPQLRLLPCLAALGGDKAAAYLADIVHQWLSDTVKQGRGSSAWDSLLEVEGEIGLPYIEELVEQMPPVLRYAGWLRLLEGGRQQWLDSVRTLVDPEVLNKASLRGKAVMLLCQSGDWQTAANAALDPNPSVRAAYIDALRMKEGELTDAEHAYLVEVAANPTKDAAYPALRALLERGESVHLEQWLAQVKGYPTRPGSIEGLHMFMQEGISHPRLVSIMIERWPYCEADFRIDIGRVMAMHTSEETVAFLEAVVMDGNEDPDVRLYSLSSLGNSGEECLPALFRIWEQQPSPGTTDRLFSSMLRYADNDQVREFCFQLIVDPKVPDFAKAYMMVKLPVSYQEAAYQPLLDARNATERAEVKQFIDNILLEYY